METKNIALIGANKEGLSLLPLLLSDKKTRICLIADSNKDAMLFKLNELGYTLSKGLGIKTTTDLNDIRNVPGLDIIINTLSDPAIGTFLESPEFKDVEKLGALSARLLWGIRTAAPSDAVAAGRGNEQTSLLGSLREIVDAVRLTVDRRELLSVILKLATESTRAERGSIMLISHEENMLRVEIAKGMDEEVVRKIRVPLGEGISGKVAKDGKAILLSGQAREEEFSRPMERRDVKSAMCVPLVVNGEVIGVVNVSSNESTHVFTNEDLAFLTSLAGLAAEVIQRSNEFERLRVDAAKYTFWKDVSSIMSTHLPINARLTEVARKLVGIIPGLTCFIYLYDEDMGRLFLKAASIKDAKGAGQMSLRPGEGMEGGALNSWKDVFLVDRNSEPLVKRVYMTLPMVSRGALVGTINGQMVSQYGLSKYHELFLKDIRNLIAESVYEFKRAESEKLKSRKMFAVDEAGLEMISIKDPKRLMPVIATTPAAVLGAEGSLLRLNQDGSALYHTVAAFGLDDKDVRDKFMPIEKETVLETLRKDEPVMREFSEEASPYVRSVLCYPFKVKGTTVAVLTMFNKSGEESFYPCAFSKSDLDTVTRFAVYVEKALVYSLDGHIAYHDEKTLPPASPMAVFERKAVIEMNRAKRADKRLVIATVRMEWRVEGYAGDLLSFENRFVAAVKKRTRIFDVGVRLEKDTFGFLFLDTGDDILKLHGALAEAIMTDPAFNKAFAEGSVEVRTGKAVYPDDGETFDALYEKASTRRRFEIGKEFEKDFDKAL